MADHSNTASRPSKKPPKTIRDENIMATNNSSIVSKRCVEKLYYPGRQEYFKPFVKKFVRRSPLISRGYWLRMKAIEHVVRCFLEEASETRKVVINLGCGYDPLPFQFLGEHSALCENAVFVDVDYLELMQKKSAVISETPLLRELLPGLATTLDGGPLVMASNRYLGIGCDLRNLSLLQKTLVEALDTSNCSYLFVAEVSITYMEVEAADAVIRWASMFPQARFCLLEQFLPDGADHPFAHTMIKHFDKLNSPLHSIHRYPLLINQRDRFLNAGWTIVDVQDLWDLWQDDRIIGREQRFSLNAVEPFDEWEELALFACHYFLLVARNNSSPAALSKRPMRSTTKNTFDLDVGQRRSVNLICSGYPKGMGLRRYGAVIPLSTDTLAYYGGMGSQDRLRTYDIYVKTRPDAAGVSIDIKPPAAAARMCHTITWYGQMGALLVGGRASPDRALADCWLCKDMKSTWVRVHDLPTARYRHCAVAVDARSCGPVEGFDCRNSGVLVFGGKQGDGNVLDEWLLWQADYGWGKLAAIGPSPRPRFGAVMSIRQGSVTGGFLAGGMQADGTVISDLWDWQLFAHDGPKIRFREVTSVLGDEGVLDLQFARFGAAMLPLPMGHLLIGGIAEKGVLQQRNEIIFLDSDLWISGLNVRRVGPRPLLIGCGMSSVQRTYSEEIAIVGGGAVCFSFGTFWNGGSYTLSSRDNIPPWRLDPAYLDASLVGLSEPLPATKNSKSAEDQAISRTTPVLKPIPRLRIRSAEEFETIVARSQPVILEKLDIGDCTRIWTPEYLKDQIGANRSVIVHAASTEHMNFQAKNFSYRTMSFGAFLDAIHNGEKLYLRAVSSTGPAEKATDLTEDFRTIASEFQLPPEIAYVKANAHSSPLRISGPVTMWLHYDVMANVLCQIFGKKRLLLYPPSDITHLGFAPGASSSSINVYEANSTSHPSLALTHPHEAVLEPGDIQFIPALWLHTAAPTDGVSIAVNVFFRNLKAGYAAGRDVYGNRDLQAYERGRKDIERIVKAFDGLPSDMASFYLGRLAAELADHAASST